ncbi:type II secretion system protein [Geobacter sp. DSM 9736]|uniref:type II secretion system protein n=1 Tax=Geobacter sp. DSM 9736 TaxID=1277350 RepID=UPI000B51369A|nr:type II secretion system protein [Geobacter sp. DSM 9736]SNB45283.1 general secretion pathway protein G [Geobacter sp. DSM 9736]
MKRLNTKGLTIVELVVTMAILSVLAALVLPSAQLVAKRNKEIELRRNLRVIRTAIDDYYKAYRDAVERDKTKAPSIKESGYPKTLELLVEGDDFGKVDGQKRKFLRRIPADPFNPPKPGEKPEWGLRSYTDKPDSTIWGEEDVYDVYSLSEDTAIDGTKYNEW